MAFGYDNKDTRSILNAARANQDILKEQPGPAGYLSGSPKKRTDPEFHKTEMAGRGLGLEGEFGQWLMQPENQEKASTIAQQYFNSRLNYDLFGAPEEPMV